MKPLNFIKSAVLLFTIAILSSCNSNPQLSESVFEKPVVVMKSPIVKKEAKIYKTEISYGIDSLTTAGKVDSLKGVYSEDQLKNILALNRIEEKRLSRQKSIIVPECASEEFLAYSPLPETVTTIQCVPKAVLISQRVQAFGLYENGELIKWGPISSGKKSTKTPNGLNYGNYKAVRKISSVDESWILPYYFNFMNYEGVGVHQYELPGYPASHGCVRLYMDDAKYIFDWATMWELESGKIEKNGTPFMVFGEYDYASEKPWLTMHENENVNILSVEEIATLENYMLKYQSDPRNFNDNETALASN
ncbi:L,D-transpeptidase [Gramella sp. AN32]|uniref:L,D-transpeptidase n=1 Tax=Christiangramia antarctica TaxID=2058158 RepID=A0ABW5X3D0_9FLAO|nr:L,D-transpeptidase [Gramella sp. AN32]MCM4155671.1 murein L,D-transpeptidase [Gramella sp. AN32]